MKLYFRDIEPGMEQLNALLLEISRRSKGSVPFAIPSGGYIDVPPEVYDECEAVGFRLNAVIQVLKRWLGRD